ncbi:GNAT family N-acetyltransferase [Xenorhabdus hominickii]|uniref:GNAT family N-acetyltransferase n=1 Tax=Xenorhabdus hominickii TaxID=351679 RepID=A0A2G0QF63_XENHO|nr:GNAT family N-acetyltransferase [Xenorhabdus hominickii]AOM41896.1 GNAT family acetyltransferase [Xenorhabdus hominickii]PHM57872.1 GNAT family N-acetyltransferase [Xenorhabdus hominickii]
MLLMRKTTTKDAELLSQLLETSYRFHFSDLWHDNDELEEYIAGVCSIEQISNSLNTPNHRWFIAESHHSVSADTDHSNIIGFGKIIFNQPIPDSDFVGTYLHKFYLMPHLTGQKYGDQLFDHVVKLCQEQEQEWLWLEVLEQNTSAIKFYVRKGLKWQKNIIFSSPKQKSTMHIMVKRLD